MDEVKKSFLIKSIGIVAIHFILLSFMFPRWAYQTSGMALDTPPLILLIFGIIFIFIISLILFGEKDYNSPKYKRGILLGYLSYIPLVLVVLLSPKLNSGNAPSVAPLILASLFIIPWFILTIISWVYFIRGFLKNEMTKLNTPPTLSKWKKLFIGFDIVLSLFFIVLFVIALVQGEIKIMSWIFIILVLSISSIITTLKNKEFSNILHILTFIVTAIVFYLAFSSNYFY